MNSKGIVFQIQNFSVNDGEGIRTAIFFAGCPLHCQWCANPEGITPKPKVAFHQNLCIGCGRCTHVCPAQLPIDLNTHGARSRCLCCGACTGVCPTEAKILYGRVLTAEEIWEKLEGSLSVFRYSGGGVTLSGGEPTFQTEFFNDLTEFLYDHGLSLALETCGYYQIDQVIPGLKRMDLIFTDIKLMDECSHIRWTGMSNKRILENIMHYQELPARIVIRVPLIHGVNADPENIRRTARFVHQYVPKAQMELLPYHTLAFSKYQALGKSTPPAALSAPSKEELKVLENIIRAEGISLYCSR